MDEALAKRVGDGVFVEEVDTILHDVSRGHSQVRGAGLATRPWPDDGIGEDEWGMGLGPGPSAAGPSGRRGPSGGLPMHGP